jgi:diadenosine tetraphosphate (Ap4A) HIT family hydrolase
MLVGLVLLVIKIHVRAKRALVMECVIRSVTQIGDALVRPDFPVVFATKRVTHSVVPRIHFHIHVLGGK